MDLKDSVDCPLPAGLRADGLEIAEGDDAEDERDGGDEEVGESHERPDEGLSVWMI